MRAKTLKYFLESNGVDFEEGDYSNSGDTLIELRQTAIDWVKRMSMITNSCYSNCEYIFCLDCDKMINISGTHEEQATERKKHNYPIEGEEHKTLIYESYYDGDGDFDQFTGAVAALKLLFDITDEELK